MSVLVSRPLALLLAILASACAGPPSSTDPELPPLQVSRADYQDRLEGFWLGSCIANWTGLLTENARSTAPFFTDDDWNQPVGRGGATLELQLEHDPWPADDDTDIEYVYQHALEESESVFLTGEQIAAEWRDHIRLPLLWVSNLAASGQMQNGAVPPQTSLPENNPMWDMIDAQLTTEIFGALAPGRPDVALDLAHLPIRTTAYLHSEWAAEFYVVMHALVPVIPVGLPPREQVLWLADEARKRVPDWSYISDMYDWVRQDWSDNQDKDDWEATRDRIHERYQLKTTAGYRYQYPWDSGINFAASIVSLLYGGGDFERTLRIGALSGWDSDNPTATWGGLLGLLLGRSGLEEQLGRTDLADAYWIERTRPNLPRSHDSITEMATRGLGIIDRVVEEAIGGQSSADEWVIPRPSPVVLPAGTPPTPVRWTTIEDDDPRWRYEGFEVKQEQWNASGATLSVGTSDCSAAIDVFASAVILFAHRNSEAGTMTVAIDENEPTVVDLASDADPHGQYYVKVFESLDLEPGEHTLRIDCDDEATTKSIDMVSIVEPS